MFLSGGLTSEMQRAAGWGECHHGSAARALHPRAYLLSLICDVQIHPTCKKQTEKLDHCSMQLSVRASAPPAAFLSSHCNQSAGSDSEPDRLAGWLAVSEVTRPEQRQSPGRERRDAWGEGVRRGGGLGFFVIFFSCARQGFTL